LPVPARLSAVPWSTEVRIKGKRKRFGQNFLTDNRVIERIVATIAPKFNDNLLEIGPGQGAMTLPLLEPRFLIRANLGRDT
jgi:16S rRNA A1518/A1519 N6-dimethyltransferase RsmA/KsgA/DIM1 with predicted DNA glycosylase/AP lyase activity